MKYGILGIGEGANVVKFLKHRGNKCPITSNQGAIVELRSGSKAVVVPSYEPFSIEAQVIWQTCNDADDIVAYSVIQPRTGDRVVKAAIDYIEAIEDAAASGHSSHQLTKQVLRSKKQELSDSIRDYQRAWPDWPETTGLRHLTEVEIESPFD